MLLTWVFAFGNLGVQSLGIKGIAIAILLTITVRSIIFLCLLRQREFSGITIYNSTWEQGVNDPWRIMKIGVPLGLTEISNHGSLAAIGLLVSQLGIVALAAHNIAFNIFALTHMLVFGLSRATVIRMGQLNGGHVQISNLRLLLLTSIVVALTLSLAPALTLYFQATNIANYYSTDPEVVNLVASLLILITFVRIIDDVALVLQGALEGLQKTRQIFKVRASCQWLIGLTSGLLFSQWLGLQGFWMGIGLALLCVAILFAKALHKALK
jgi:MATE family multidrug resistance protein